MVKICLVIHSLGIGGMERVMALLANNFAGRPNLEVHIILIGRRRNVAYQLSDLVHVHKPEFEFDNSRRGIDTIRTVIFLRSEVKKIKPDVILSFGEMWNNLVLIALKGFDVPIYISDRSQPGKDLGKLHNYLRNRLYPTAAGYIAQTQKAKEVCLANGWNTNIKVTGNPIRLIPTNNLDQKENIVLSVGRLIQTKHFDQLIRMFIDIADPNWKLVIVGGDAKKKNLSKELRALIKNLEAEEQVFLEGEQKNIDAYYQRSKIFAFTSSSEGFPNVIGEALSSGLPVVAYDCVAGPSDMITNGKNGYLVPLFNQEIFKQKLARLMSDENLRFGVSNNTGQNIKAFRTEYVADQYYQFLVGAINSPKPKYVRTTQ